MAGADRKDELSRSPAGADAVCKPISGRGTGYPAGVQGDKIPLIARIIHVVESFIALISRRNYHGIFDKESAIKELMARPNFYDQKIVDVLDSLV